MNASLRRLYPGRKRDIRITEEALDKIIAEVIPKKHQRKSAKIILGVCEASGGVFSADEVADRLAELVRDGVYAGYGDLKKWAYSEIGPIRTDD